MTVSLFLIYCSVTLLSVLSPGPAVMLALHNGAHHGWRTACLSSFGNICGLFCMAVLSMLGLGALMMSSALLFTVVKLLGAVYLIYLGIKQWRRGLPGARLGVTVDGKSAWAYYREGLLLALTNPKAILFLTALLPQFLQTDQALLPQFLLLTGTLMALSFSVLVTYAGLAALAQQRLLGVLRADWFARISGTCFVLLGLALLRLKQRAA